MTNDQVTILCSGVALGVYIPGLLLRNRLENKKIPVEVVVVESLYKEGKKETIVKNKKAFHNNFSVAKLGHKLARGIDANIDESLLDDLFKQWKAENRSRFIVFSGFWMNLIEKYKEVMHPVPIEVDIVHMDADISASWRSYKKDVEGYRHIWLYSWTEKKLIYNIPVTDKPPIPYNSRENRFVIHGGGWGMGTYKEVAAILEKKEINLDVVTYYWDDLQNENKNNRYYMMNPQWKAWEKDTEGQHEFPLFGQRMKNGQVDFKNRKEYHELFEVIRYDKAIISKPGGATLLDSLEAETPIVMLEPLGDYEQTNADLWEYLGFGISYDKWKDLNYDTSIFQKFNENIMTYKKKLMDYGEEFCATENGC